MVKGVAHRTPSQSVWQGRSVLVTGHTGFKGSWLTRLLGSLGAFVHGVALDPPTTPSLFATARVSEMMVSDRRVDVRDASAVMDAVGRTAPSVIFHLAAQPLVRDGFRRPSETFATNTMGTVNVLEAARATNSVEAIVAVTTDKVYLPRHLSDSQGAARSSGEPAGTRAHRESDPLGAEDPYGWSKVAAEHAVAAFRGIPAIGSLDAWSLPVATARAGNVVGGGDWSSERLVPDCIRSFSAAGPVTLRFPQAVRPWQHVLDPLNGYLLLAEELLGPQGGHLARAFNFGPSGEAERTVEEVARRIAELWGPGARVSSDVQGDAPHENPVLRLDSSLARETLEWTPVWDLNQTLSRTVEWYRDVLNGGDGAAMVDQQIADYVECART
jgi:CDP-glucose 4,6-dehydratase